MHVTLVHVRVKPDRVDEFIAAIRENHDGSVKEPGNLRFDVLQSEDDPTRFVLYEVFRTSDDAAAHKRTPHYLAWRRTVEAWMAAPREGKNYRALAPEDPGRW
ncbi:MAG: antibiotic biosynthesis monooxygenase [Acidobacteriia bacterium]|nr:antibiotic biosynthesis monooxygenase [Terriglobia bacterium]